MHSSELNRAYDTRLLTLKQLLAKYKAATHLSKGTISNFDRSDMTDDSPQILATTLRQRPHWPTRSTLEASPSINKQGVPAARLLAADRGEAEAQAV